jgi:hypothetical protein
MKRGQGFKALSACCIESQTHDAMVVRDLLPDDKSRGRRGRLRWPHGGRLKWLHLPSVVVVVDVA